MRYLRLAAIFKAREKISFPGNPVNTLRGAVGFRLKDLVCFQRNRGPASCRGCLAEQACFFVTCWEPSFPPADKPELGPRRDIPHPVVFDSNFAGPAEFAPGEVFSFGLTAFGPAVDGLPYLVLALDEAANNGLSRTKGRAELVSIRLDHMDGPVVYDGEKRFLEKVEPLSIDLDDPNGFPDGSVMTVGIDFLSPTSFKAPVGTGKVVNLPEFHRLIRSILKRCSSFQAADRRPTPKWDFGAIFARAEKIRLVRSELSSAHWERFSTRQQQRVFWGGVTGTAWYEGNIEPFLPILRAGEIIRVGRATTFGQGVIRVYSPSLAPTG